MDRKATLDAAADAVLRDRNTAYGPPENSFATVAALWTTILAPVLKDGASVSAVQAVLCLDALKTARLIANPTHADSWVDKAGYAACGAEVAQQTQAPATTGPHLPVAALERLEQDRITRRTVG